MRTVRCYLEGARPTAAGNSVRLQLRMNAHFFDRNLMTVEACCVGGGSNDYGLETERVRDGDKGELGDMAEELSPHIGQSVLTRSFLGDSRTVLFEYRPESSGIVCDGTFGLARDYTRHTPMTTWDIRLVQQPECGSSCGDEADGGDNNSIGVYLSGFRAVVMEFQCEVVWMSV